jgi:thiol-disulfide isomerase/thioredoxin
MYLFLCSDFRARHHGVGDISVAAIESSIARGADYLICNQNQNGHWNDYRLTVGQSDAWVTGVASLTLQNCANWVGGSSLKALQEAYDRSQRWFDTSHRESGWGYNELADTDSDTTAWVLRSRKKNIPPDNNAIDFAQYQRIDGGVATFAHSKWRDWAKATNDITANVLLGYKQAPKLVRKLDIARAIKFLVKNQRSDGAWDAYWWDSDCVATALSAEALSAYANDGDAVIRACRFIRSNQRNDGGWGRHRSNTIDTALCVRILLRIDNKDKQFADPCIARGLKWLCSQQGNDGRWPPSDILAVPFAENANDLAAPVTADFCSIMSTSLAVNALCQAMETLNAKSYEDFQKPVQNTQLLLQEHEKLLGLVVDDWDDIFDKRISDAVRSQGIQVARRFIDEFSQAGTVNNFVGDRAMMGFRYQMLAILIVFCDDSQAKADVKAESEGVRGFELAALAKAVGIFTRWCGTAAPEEQSNCLDDYRDIIRANSNDGRIAEILVSMARHRAANSNLAARAWELLGDIDYKNAVARDSVAEFRAESTALKKESIIAHLQSRQVDGTQTASGRWQNRVVVAEFWAPTCGPCLVKIPQLVEDYRLFHHKGLEMVGIPVGVTNREVLQFLTVHREMCWPQLDESTTSPKLNDALNIQGIPAAVLIDKKGAVRRVAIRRRYRHFLEMLLSENSE